MDEQERAALLKEHVHTIEIIILPLERPPRAKTAAMHKKNAGGMLSKYKNVKLWEQEASAWERAVKEKYVNR